MSTVSIWFAQEYLLFQKCTVTIENKLKTSNELPGVMYRLLNSLTVQKTNTGVIRQT